MQYFYSEKFFARDLFDAAKGKLQGSFPNSSFMPRHWLDAMNYGGNFLPFSHSVKFRSIRGKPLHIASAPLCSRDPVVIGRLPRAAEKAAVEPDASPNPCIDAATQSASGTAVDWPPDDNAGPAQGTPLDNDTGQERSADVKQAAALQPSSPKISTALLSALLSVAAAVTAGVIVGNSNGFKLQHGNSQRGGDMLADAGTAADDTHAAPRLTLDTAPPASFRELSSIAESGLATQARNDRQGEATGKRAVARRKEMPRPAIDTRARRHSARGKHKATSAPATRSSMAHKAPSRPAIPAATKHHVPLQVKQSGAQPGTQYARCVRMKGLLRRERCKWEVCGGKWGKQGCPAYQHNAMPELGYGMAGKLEQTHPPAVGHTEGGG